MTPARGRLLALGALGGGVAAVVLAIVLQGLVGPARHPLPAPGTAPQPIGLVAPLGDGEVRLLAAGDIGQCGSLGAAATGALLAAIPDATVLALGDLAYERGSAADFRDCYDPAWGHAKARTIPVAGNHEHGTPGAAGYFGYFGPAAGTPERPWRAIDLGAWRLYALDSECGPSGTCDPDAQLDWLQTDLATAPACIIAAWHRPRWSSGPHGPTRELDPLWRALASAGGDVVLAAHDHLLERFTPLDGDGRPALDGVRSWVVGTGGGQGYIPGRAVRGSELIHDRTHGLLELVLRPGGYAWRFRAAMGEPVEDVGSGTC